MKKITLVMITVLFAVLSGCGKSSDSTGPSYTSPMVGTWDLTTSNGAAPSGYDLIIVISSNGNWTATVTPTSGGTCAVSGTSSTSGSNNLTMVTNIDDCTTPAPTLPKTETGTYSVNSTSLTISLPGEVSVFTKI